MAITAAALHRLADGFDWASWRDTVRAALEPHYRAIALEQGQRAVDQLTRRTRKAAQPAADDGFDWDPDDPYVERFFTAYLGERITQLEETTRDLVREVLQSALEDDEGESLTELAGRVRDAVADSHAFSPARALTIARTETANAYNAGAVLGYRQNGITHVEVSDGDGDEDCAAVDGEVWTLDEALANPTEHPNCTRSFSPVVDEDEEE